MIWIHLSWITERQINRKISRQRDMDESEETPKAYRTPSSVADSSKSRSEKMHNASAMTVYGAFVNGFWTFVDMVSGRYLLVSVSKKAD
ncbi:hypothetical protein Hanom_Chr04g00375911 [Helianthus anomalus]